MASEIVIKQVFAAHTANHRKITAHHWKMAVESYSYQEHQALYNWVIHVLSSSLKFIYQPRAHPF
jgi:hypothetical protein